MERRRGEIRLKFQKKTIQQARQGDIWAMRGLGITTTSIWRDALPNRALSEREPEVEFCSRSLFTFWAQLLLFQAQVHG